ncbi:histidine phosphatase family protein [uncultured Sulfitobacter sp.]|uniref:histidine phosphatase family protein n=1 Tax=uncultured Sulfitobacter sp. TaxID=191468 RepID=UPI0030D8C3B0
MPRLALLRHGHTPWNREGRIQGRTDVPLDDAARAQLQGFCLPAPWDSAKVWSSPLARAFETAQIVSDQHPVTDPALIEMDFGDWEGRKSHDLFADTTSGFRHIEDWGWQFSPPGGERLTDVKNRLNRWAEALTEDALAVCHIGVMRVLMAQATGWGFDGPAPFQIKRNRLYTIRIAKGSWQLEDGFTRLVERGL